VFPDLEFGVGATAHPMNEMKRFLRALQKENEGVWETPAEGKNHAAAIPGKATRVTPTNALDRA